MRKIFELSIAGLGGYTIAKQLNAKNVPAFGPSPNWDQSTIHNMLRNRATIGEYQPGKFRNKRQAPSEIDPVPNYYPAVIEEKLFLAAQEARKRNLIAGRGRKGRLITNLFAGLSRCFYCDSAVRFHSNGNAKSLICSTVLEGRGCYRMCWSYQDFENSFLEFLEKNGTDARLAKRLKQLRSGTERQSEPDIYDARMEIGKILKATITRLTIASAGTNPSAGKADARIRRDHPARFFTVAISAEDSQVGFPAVSEPTEQGLKLSVLDLSKFLGLTRRQSELTALLASGLTLAKSAENLGMTFETARWHMRKIFQKTNTHRQIDLVKVALQTAAQPRGTKG